MLHICLSVRWDGCKRESVVAVALKNFLIVSLDIPYGVSDRIITMRLPVINGRFVTLASVYDPTMDSCEGVSAASIWHYVKLFKIYPHQTR